MLGGIDKIAVLEFELNHEFLYFVQYEYPKICFIVRQKLINRRLICDDNHKSDGQIFEIQRRSSLGMKHSVESACSF